MEALYIFTIFLKIFFAIKSVKKSCFFVFLTDVIAKKVLKKMPSFSEVQASPWISTECGPVLKSELKKNLFRCPKCNKNQRIVNAKDRFDVFFSG